MNLAGLTYHDISREHPDRQFWVQKWPDYRLAYEGGFKFLQSSGQAVGPASGQIATAASLFVAPISLQTPRRRFLRQLEGEPNAVYMAIWDRAFYINYLGGILDYFRQYLFSSPPVFRFNDSSQDEDHPDWWCELGQDANGNGVGFVDFVKDSFLDVLICRRAGWLIGKSTSVGATAKGDERVVLTPYAAEEIYDWQQDENGELEWIVLHKKTSRREFPEERRDYEVYTYIDRQQWQSWEVVNDTKNGTKSLEPIAGDTHGLGFVPFVNFEIPPGLWITDKLYSWQIDIFNKQVRLTNAQLMGCIVQPYLVSSDQNAIGRVFGEGVLLHLRAADAVGGGAEDFGWKTPSVEPLEFIAKQVDAMRDEGYRIVHNMAMAVDATASRLAQSGVSKQEDRKAAEIILCGFGGYVREAMLRTIKMLAKVYGDDVDPAVVGYDNFQVSSLEEELQTASLVQTFGMWSKTAEAELHKNIESGRLLGHLDEETKETIRKEIEDRKEQEQEAAMAPQMDAMGNVIGPGAMPAKPGVPASPAVVKPKPPVGQPNKPSPTTKAKPEIAQ